jgi:hypothetical protein
MALVDMKLSKKEAKEEVGLVKTTATEGPRYPYGLSLDLNDESMEKLGLSAKSFSVGEEIVIKAKGKVKRLSASQYENEEKNESMDIQITHLEVVSSDKFEEAFKEASEKKED